jgi:hypothetical protein
MATNRILGRTLFSSYNHFLWKEKKVHESAIMSEHPRSQLLTHLTEFRTRGRDAMSVSATPTPDFQFSITSHKKMADTRTREVGTIQ